MGVTATTVLAALKAMPGVKGVTCVSPSSHSHFTMRDDQVLDCTDRHAHMLVDRCMQGPWGMAVYIRKYSRGVDGPSQLSGFRVTRGGAWKVLAESLENDTL